MKQSQLEALVEMIVRRTFAEMHDSFTADANNNVVTIEGIQLPDGRTISANVGIEGSWDDGAFGYEYGSIKGVHRYAPQFELDSYHVEKAWDAQSNQEIPLTPELIKLISAEFESIQDEVQAEIDANPPDNEPDFPEPDDR